MAILYPKFWGLVKQVGPWDTTRADLQRGQSGSAYTPNHTTASPYDNSAVNGFTYEQFSTSNIIYGQDVEPMQGSDLSFALGGAGKRGKGLRSTKKVIANNQVFIDPKTGQPIDYSMYDKDTEMSDLIHNKQMADAQIRRDLSINNWGTSGAFFRRPADMGTLPRPAPKPLQELAASQIPRSLEVGSDSPISTASSTKFKFDNLDNLSPGDAEMKSSPTDTNIPLNDERRLAGLLKKHRVGKKTDSVKKLAKLKI